MMFKTIGKKSEGKQIKSDSSQFYFFFFSNWTEKKRIKSDCSTIFENNREFLVKRNFSGKFTRNFIERTLLRSDYGIENWKIWKLKMKNINWLCGKTNFLEFLNVDFSQKLRTIFRRRKSINFLNFSLTCCLFEQPAVKILLSVSLDHIFDAFTVFTTLVWVAKELVEKIYSHTNDAPG